MDAGSARSRLWQLTFRFAFAVGAVALTTIASACSSRRAAETLLLGNHFVLTKGISYGSNPANRLDVYRPRDSGQRSPVVVFLYGGRWQSGAKEEYRLVGDALTRRGIVVVIPDYRMYPDARFPAWVEDGARAVRWSVDNIRKFNGDSSRIFIIGHSAGAHTAALLALDERYLRAAGVAAQSVRGVVSMAGPVDTTWTDADVQALMGPPAGWPATYPASHIDGTEMPLLFLHGESDETVAQINSSRLNSRILERNGCARLISYPGVGHVEIVVALALPWLRRAPVVADILSFIHDPVRAGGCNDQALGVPVP